MGISPTGHQITNGKRNLYNAQISVHINEIQTDRSYKSNHTQHLPK